ncbi:MAG: hypothetical protein AAFY43_01765, partial [Pseudomonadota bacterium]
QGGIGANLAAAGLALAGQKLIAGLAPTPGQPGAPQIEASRSNVASADGNTATPNGAIPRVLGTHKVFPPLACEPLVYYDGPDEVVEAVYILAGPHKLDNVKLGNVPIEDVQGLSFQTLEGWPGQGRQELVKRYARTEEPRAELFAHTLLEDGLTADTGAENGYLPQPYTLATRQDADEYRLSISFAQGLNRNGDDSVAVRIPFRLRIRPAGTTTWTNLPELHYAGGSLRELRATIRLLFSDDGPNETSAPSGEGFVEARRFSPGQVAVPATPDYAAHPSFGSTGDGYVTAANPGTAGMQNILCTRYEARIYLNSTDFPKGRYEVEIVRGSAMVDANWNAATYTYSGNQRDPFGVAGGSSLQVITNQKNLFAGAFLVRGSSIWNDDPVQTDDCAVIAVLARNRQLGPCSTLAGGYVQDWDGSAWTNWTTTSNPAPHLRAIYASEQNALPVPVDIIDDAELVDWRTRCIAQGYEVNTIIEEGTVESAATLVAASGFGQPRQSNVWGVVQGQDFTGQSPKFTLTPRNSRGLSFSKQFSDVPDGIIATFRDKDRDYIERQIVEPPNAIGGLLEQRSYFGEVTEAEVRRRVRFELASIKGQSTIYSVTAPPEAIAMKRGDLVGLTHDTLFRQAGAARVASWTTNGSGELTSLTLDDNVTIANEPDVLNVVDMLTVENVLDLGARYFVTIRARNGSPEFHELSNPSESTNVLTLLTPAVSTAVHQDALIAVGPLGSETVRVILTSVEPQDELTARLTLVDEAPQIWAA